MTSVDNVLAVDGLVVLFRVRSGFLRTSSIVPAVDGVSFEIRRGETLGLVGESGCGKSTICRAILGLVKPTAGRVLLDGRAVVRRDLDFYRKVQIVFQDPLASLNPRLTVQAILTEGLVCHGLLKPSQRREKAAELLESVGLDSSALDRYPHEFSGGQRQRICIARAIALGPELLICDEAVSALDLSIRAQVLELLETLKKKLSLSILFITHDLGVVRHVADRVLVMNAGRIVESGSCAEVLTHPRDAYTRRLVDSVPVLRRMRSSSVAKESDAEETSAA